VRAATDGAGAYILAGLSNGTYTVYAGQGGVHLHAFEPERDGVHRERLQRQLHGRADGRAPGPGAAGGEGLGARGRSFAAVGAEVYFP
jgi:hypothetical protein